MTDETKYTWYDSKNDILYIEAHQLMPNTRGMSFREHCKALDAAFAMPYEDRIEAYASALAKEVIYDQLRKHKGCRISEYISA